MRIDKFLNVTSIVKRRVIAQDMLNRNLVSINGVKVKQSKEVKINDLIAIEFMDSTRKFVILDIPLSKTIPSSSKRLYIKEIED